MHSIRNILSRDPLKLNYESALLFSRYLIEDVQEEFVYCDELN